VAAEFEAGTHRVGVSLVDASRTFHGSVLKLDVPRIASGLLGRFCSELPDPLSSRLGGSPKPKGDDMYVYEVRFLFQGRSLAETIKATSGGDAIHAIRARYPGAAIFGATRVS